MSLSFFSSLFRSKSKSLKLPDSILIKRIKEIADEKAILLFDNVAIYHHSNKYIIPLLLLDEKRGLYIFDKKEWTYDELKNATIEQSENEERSRNTLSFGNIQSLINQKLNELTHKGGVPLFNYLLMENLNASQYEHLNDSFKRLLPHNKIIFSDSNKEEIITKLEKSALATTPLASADHILGNLLIQYAILDKTLKPFVATKKQIEFLKSDMQGLETLYAVEKSGASSLLLLKAITQKLNQPDKQIIIIKPTLLAVEILKKRVLEIIEHAIIEIDFASIEIITPIELLNRHLTVLKMGLLKEDLHVSDPLMQKKHHHADTIFCDDANLLPVSFIEYLVHIQKGQELLLVNSTLHDSQFRLETSFIETPDSLTFYHANQHAKALQLIFSLSQKEENIMILCEQLTREKLLDDMQSFIEKEPNIIDASKNLMDQKLNGLILTGYDDINELAIDNLILLDICSTPENKINYALKRAYKSVHLVYEEECINIQQLKEAYENS